MPRYDNLCHILAQLYEIHIHPCHQILAQSSDYAGAEPFMKWTPGRTAINDEQSLQLQHQTWRVLLLSKLSLLIFSWSVFLQHASKSMPNKLCRLKFAFNILLLNFNQTFCFENWSFCCCLKFTFILSDLLL